MQMFKVENNVPDVYVNESRDFQLFARLYDLVYHSCRYSIDSMENISDSMRCNDKLLPLLADKVGFFTDLRLTSKADRKILSAFPYIIKYKGSLYGIELVTNLFEQIMNTSVSIEHDFKDTNHVKIIFEDYTPDVNLLYSLLEYIRPTGLFVDYAVRTNLPAFNDILTTEDEVQFRSGLLQFDDSEATESGVIVQVTADNDDFSDVASNVGFTEVVDKPSDIDELEETE